MSFLQQSLEGILLVNKERNRTSFYLVKILRKLSKIKKVGHAGTLDPFATGVMVMLIGRPYTKMANRLIEHDKEYIATIRLGISTSTYDCDGEITKSSNTLPTIGQVEEVISEFQGQIEQIPPMYSAKKVDGKRLYLLARQGIEIERKPIRVEMAIEILDYSDPYLKLQIQCSKGSYIRTLAHDIGEKLTCGGHLAELTRTRSGPYQLKDCIDSKTLSNPFSNLIPYLKKEA